MFQICFTYFNSNKRELVSEWIKEYVLDPGSFPEQPGQQAGDYGGDYDMVTISNSYIALEYILGVLVSLQ